MESVVGSVDRFVCRRGKREVATCSLANKGEATSLCDGLDINAPRRELFFEMFCENSRLNLVWIYLHTSQLSCTWLTVYLDCKEQY